MEKKKLPKVLITHSLVNVSKEMFKQHPTLITQIVEKRSGIYALYKNKELYYVGRAAQLKSRVKRHLSNHHYPNWTHFSFYVVENSWIGEIESILVRIAKPKGNKANPKGRDISLNKDLSNLLKKTFNETHDILLPGAKTSRSKIAQNRILKGLVDKNTSIFRTYKGVKHTAVLTPAGTIRYKSKIYSSATAAAKAVVDGRVNGWRFWKIKNSAKQFVKLKEYR